MAESKEDHVAEWFQHLISNIGIQLDPSEESETKFLCNNCRRLAYLPYKTKCNHLFCSKCLKILISKGGKCLIDNQVLQMQDVEVSLSLKKLILNVTLPCPYKEQGCLESINIGTAWEHTNKCAHTYAIIDCPWKCGRKVQLNDLYKHFETNCHRHPENSSPITFSLVQSNVPAAKQAAAQRSRSKTPVVNMFKTPNMSPGYVPQYFSPHRESKGNKTITFAWPILHYLKLKQRQMICETHHQDSDLFAHPDLAYQFKIRVFLNGSGYGRGTHVSLFIGVERGFNKSSSFVHPHKLTVKILSQKKACNEIQMDIKKSLVYDANKSAFQENMDKSIFEFYGFRKFCEQSKAEHSDYLKNGALIFEVVKELL